MAIFATLVVGAARLAIPEPSGLRVGLATGPAEDLGEVDWVSNLDARIMRHVFTSPPDAWDDSFYRRTALRGITVVPVVEARPMPTSGAGRQAFAELVLAHVRRFGPRGSFWDDNPDLPRVVAPPVFEILNEPYIESIGGPYDPDGYARLVRRTSELVRPADSSVRLAMATATTFFGGGDNGKPWLAALYRSVPDLNEHFDIASLHPYAGDPDRCDPAYRWCFRQLEVVKAMLDARGAGDKRFYISEVGNNTGGQSASTEREQARYLRRYVELAKSYGYVDALLYYNYRDLCTDPGDKECWFGVLRQDGSPKPAFEALRRAASANR